MFMNKEILVIIVKIILYAVGLFAAYFGVSVLTSCSASHSVQSTGRTTIVVTDTTFVNHGGYIRSKDFINYSK